MNNLYIIGNEKISQNNNTFYSANVDFKTIIEGLRIFFKLILVARKSLKKENFVILLSNQGKIKDFLLLTL